MAAVMAVADDSVVQNDDDDQKSLLNKDKKTKKDTNTKKKDGIKGEKKAPTFWQWIFKNPLSKLPFVYFVVGFLGCFALAVFHFMDPDTSFIILGAYIALNIFGLKHFYTLIGLKKEVDTFGNLNQKFLSEHNKLSRQVDQIRVANESLRESQNRIRAANAKNRENLGQFTALQETMKAMNLQSIDELKGVMDKANKIGDKWQDQLIEHERDMLHTVFDRYEEASGKSGMTIKEFEEFSKQLPESYQRRFARLGTFEKISHDGVHLNFSDFDAALDLFAEMDALDCDIEFSIEKSTNNNKKKEKQQLGHLKTVHSKQKKGGHSKQKSSLQIIPIHDIDEFKDDFGGISEMKRWRTTRKKYDDYERNIVVHSRTFRTKQAREFTSGLGLADNDESKSDDGNNNDQHYDESDEPDVDWGRVSGGLGREDTANDLIAAGRMESQSERKGLLKKGDK